MKTPELEQLQKDLVKFCRSELNLTNAIWRNHPFNPHVTLAFRDLRKEKFYEAWKEFQHREFKKAFETRALTLLRHTGMEWMRCKEIPLMMKSQKEPQ